MTLDCIFADLNLRQSRWTGFSAILGGGDLYLTFNVSTGTRFRVQGVRRYGADVRLRSRAGKVAGEILGGRNLMVYVPIGDKAACSQE
jgi:hypothetical protein